MALLPASVLLGWLSTAQAQGPGESLRANEFFTYLLGTQDNIGTDKDTQNHWLAKQLIAQVNAATKAVEKARKLPEVDGPDPRIPDNRTFLDSWDLPSRCTVQDKAKRSARNRVEVLCSWGKETNYPGMTRRYTVQFSREQGTDKVLDIVPHDTPYATGSVPLSQALKELTRDANALTDHWTRAPSATHATPVTPDANR